MQNHTGASPEERESFWTKFIEEFRLSPLALEPFCRKKGVSKKSYYLWRLRLEPKHPEWGEIKKVRRAKRAPTKVNERATRRTFTASYKEKIVRETQAAAPGQIASILRREGLYTSHLQKWRSEMEQGTLKQKMRGPKSNPFAEENERLKKQLRQAEKKLAQANSLLDLQKKSRGNLENLDGKERGRVLVTAINERGRSLSIKQSCAFLEFPRANYYRVSAEQTEKLIRRSRTSPRALSEAERADVLAMLHDERFIDKAPAAIVAQLLDEGA